MSAFQIQLHAGPGPEGFALIRLSGPLDIGSLAPLNDAFETLVAQRRCMVVVDCEEVLFISSPAVGVLMGARRRMQECGGDLVVAGLGPDLLEKMNLMGANRVFRFYPDTDAAFRGFHWENLEQQERLSLELPARGAYVPSLRRIVSGVLQQKGYSVKESFRVETIVDELANNAIEHGDPEQKKFFIDLGLSKKKVEIAVRNAHLPMDPSTLARVREKFMNPVVDDESIRGRGLALVKMLSSQVDLQIDSGNTLVRVTKMREE